MERQGRLIYWRRRIGGYVTPMRCVIALIICTIGSPASAWEFSPDPVCTVTHETSDLSLRLTYDPKRSDPYTIALTAPSAWPDGATFGLAYSGGQNLTITTPRHQLSDNGRTVSVSDQGFGNVLNGFEFNRTATAFLGGTERAMDLTGAATAIQDFRACIVQPVA